MEVQQQLFGLMAVAEEHQKAVKAALDGLAAERAALAKERAAVAQAAQSVAGVAGEVKKAAAEAIPAIQKAAGSAVGDAVRVSLAGASETAANALSAAAKPVIGSLSGAVQAAGEAERSLKNAGQWFAWKWVAVAAGGLAGLFLVALGAVAWQRHQVEQLAEQKAALQASVAELEKKGGRIRLDRCGPDSRLCVEIARDQGGGSPAPYAGAWQSSDKQRQYVIPRGY